MNWLDRILYSPFNVQVVVTRRCNLACGYCNEYDHKSAPVELETLKKYFKKLHGLGTYSITFSGGEPLLHPKIVEAVYEAKKQARIVTVITNGFLITEKLIKELNNAKLDGIQMSIDGVSPDKTTVKVLEKLESKIEMLRRWAKFKVNINSVIGAKNPSEAVEVMRMAKKFGFTTTIGLLHDDKGIIKLTAEQLEAFRVMKSEMRKPWWDTLNVESSFVKRRIPGFKCRSGSRYLYIDEDGWVRYCSQQKEMYGNKLLDYTPADLKKNFYKYKPCCQGCTIGCVRRASWFDEWRRQDSI